jgi:hypothetical protein
MTELSALNIKITGDATDLKAAVAAANGDLAKLIAGAEAAGLKVGKIPDKFTKVSGAAAGMSNTLRGAAQQLSQVGQQTMATGNFVQALAIQLPDLGLAFGAAGAAAGLLAGIALPLLISAFGGASEKAAALAAATKELTDATAAFRLQAAAITMGVDQEEVLVMQEINNLVQQRTALEAQMAETTGRALIPMQLQHKSIQDQLRALYGQIDAYRTARSELETMRSRADAITSSMGGMVKNTVAAKDAVVAMVANAPSGGWLSGAIGDAGALAAKLWNAAQAMSSLQANGSAQVGNAPPPKLGYSGGAGVGTINMPTGGGGGGGGGGGTNPIIGELETLQNSLMTQEQLQIESYTRQQETLRAALDQRLITQTEYAAMMEAAQQQHSDKMSAIDVYRYGDGLQKAGAFFGAMADAMSQGNEKMLKLGRAFGAAEALINAWRAYAQVLATPGINPLAKFAAAAKVLAAGMGAVNAIKGGGKTSASGAMSGASTQATSSPTQTLNFTITNDPFGFGERVIRQIAAQLNQAQRNGVNIQAAVKA